ncbi:hypothetical protein EVAR_28286_1 [Eumeta japonica]|uniref:Uncharacterized protein n=1 Tax=Eumeta variegata TaxID=151549 RepID=A0A4C1V8R2_EUMVA|nr:hypothetical protein EVAR_28286_1 [Eumeta japonica]
MEGLKTNQETIAIFFDVDKRSSIGYGTEDSHTKFTLSKSQMVLYTLFSYINNKHFIFRHENTLHEDTHQTGNISVLHPLSPFCIPWTQTTYRTGRQAVNLCSLQTIPRCTCEDPTRVDASVTSYIEVFAQRIAHRVSYALSASPVTPRSVISSQPSS